MGILNFLDEATEELAAGIDNKKTRRLLPLALHRNALKKIQMLRAAKTLQDLDNFPGLRLEKLKGSRLSEYSIRINDQFRVCFKWQDAHAYDVTIEDYR